MKIIINNKTYEASEGETVLDICRRENIPIPTLCAHDELKKEAVCRLCLVEISNVNAGTGLKPVRTNLVPSCVAKVLEGLEVITESENIKKAREVNMELLWTDHAGKCVTCKKNRRCELQNLAEEYKIENFHFVPRKGEMTTGEELELLKDNWSRVVVDEENPVIARTTELCIECRRCINVCPTKEYGFNHRAGDTIVGTPYEQPLDCIFCGQCAKHCPTGAITDQGNLDKIIAELDDINKLAVALVHPVVMKSVSFELENIKSEDNLVAVLHAIGFERVMDLKWGMDVYGERMKKLVESKTVRKRNNSVDKTVLSSGCVAFERYVKKYYPEFSGNIADIDIPDEIMAEAVKNEYARQEKIDPKNIVVISISPCTAKKADKYKNLGHIITVRELGRIARKKNIGEDKAKEARFDSFIADPEKAGDWRNDGIKYKKAVGIEEIKNALDDIRKKKANYDFVEGFVCPGGCENGGGQALKI